MPILAASRERTEAPNPGVAGVMTAPRNQIELGAGVGRHRPQAVRERVVRVREERVAEALAKLCGIEVREPAKKNQKKEIDEIRSEIESTQYWLTTLPSSIAFKELDVSDRAALVQRA